MANTYTLIASSTVGAGGASSIDFTSIPSTFTDLLVKFSGRTNASALYETVTIKFNNNSSSYSQKLLYGNGSSALSAGDAFLSYQWAVSANATASTFNNAEIYVPNYAGSTNKSVSVDSVSENNATGAIASLNAGLWSNTSAINQITLTPASGSFVQYSTAYLYGVKNA
jgi:hypothetical protein